MSSVKGTVSAFSSSSQDAMTRPLDVNPDTTADNLPIDEFNAYYEIAETAEEIIRNDYKRVALQFPDELLHNSVPVYQELKERIGDGRELYVLADTSYGSCCVDEVSAQHVDADVTVHYGYACMSQTSRLPVIYIFGKKKVDTDHCVQALIEAIKSNASADCQHLEGPILLRHDVSFTHQAGKIANKLEAALEPLSVSLHYTTPRTRSAPAPLNTAPSEDVKPSVQYPIILYIGGESLGLTNLLMTNAASNVISYDPLTSATRLESSRTNKLLLRRYTAVQKARDSDVFGILVGTLGVASYLPLIKHLRASLTQKQKKTYTICVGKLNPAKLANFLEIECFVLVACPENSLVEAKDFLRPIVTPFELEIALRAEHSWTGQYVLDFNQIMAEFKEGKSETAEKDKQDNDEQKEEDLDEPIFSLVTGKYRHPKRYGGKPDTAAIAIERENSLVLRNQEGQLTALQNSAAAQFLHSRSFRGLDPRIGQDAPGVLERGRSGIARGYEADRVLGALNGNGPQA